MTEEQSNPDQGSIIQRLDRIEALLEQLVAALLVDQDDDDEPSLTLDGQQSGRPRDEGQPL
jgi:ribosome assembly protein YihI (activator of Der GTPase)